MSFGVPLPELESEFPSYPHYQQVRGVRHGTARAARGTVSRAVAGARGGADGGREHVSENEGTGVPRH